MEEGGQYRAMRLCYQVATPDVAIAESVTAYQGGLEDSCRELAEFGFDGVEFMTLNPYTLNWSEVKSTLEKYGMSCTLICTGEIYGQLGLSYTDQDPKKREEAIRRTKDIINFAGFLDANINIGRIRGHYCAGLTKEDTENLAISAFQELADYAAPRNVKIALEEVTIMQTNFLNTLSETVNMIERVDRPNFRLMMDVFHMNLEEKDIFEAIRKYSDYNIHVHLADNNRRFPGQCGLDFEKIFRTFNEVGYTGDFTTEIYQLPDMRGAAKGAAEYLIPLMRRIFR